MRCSNRKLLIVFEGSAQRERTISQYLKTDISGTLEVISLKFGMWSAEVGGSVHSKNRLVSSRQHRASEVQKLHFLSSCLYLRVLRAGFLGRTTHYHVS